MGLVRPKNASGFATQAGLVVSLAILTTAVMLSPAGVQGKKKAASMSPKAKVGGATSYERDVKPLVDKYCGSCHYDKKNPSGGLSLLGFASAQSVKNKPELWERVAKNLSSRHMPPEGMPAPSATERDRMVAWIESAITADCKLSEPGRVTMRRLNREEYNNTIRDLVGIDLRPADDFPSDDVGHGFDNIGDVLSVSPLLMEKYITAAEKVAERVITIPLRAHEKVNADAFVGPRATTVGGETIVYTNGSTKAALKFPRNGPYLIRIKMYGQQAGPDPVRVKIGYEGVSLKTLDVPQTKAAPATVEVKVDARAGIGNVNVDFLNDFFDSSLPAGKADRNLVLLTAEVEGPLDVDKEMPAIHRRIIPVDPEPGKEDAAAKLILRNFATRAYRRPATEEDVERLMSVYRVGKKTGEGFERNIQLGLTAALVSPHFLYRVEQDNPGTRSLNGYELASRLSYFLWSSMPDDELLGLAKTNKLQDSKVLALQVRRMLASPKSKALTDNFAGQWLNLRLLANISPDVQLFPDWSEDLRASMLAETKMFFESVKSENRSVLDFLNGPYSYLNETLAKHYGIPGVTGKEMRKVVFKDSVRGGLLTQGAILTLTSNPTRTSPVKRGKWVLEQILGTPPPPPPPGVPDLKDGASNTANLTVRKRLEEHRKNPACAACHARMDPLGFGLENFDAVGAWRTSDGDKPIDSTGVLPGGKTFAGPAQLRTILVSNKDQFVRSLAEKMLTYGLGRGLTLNDKCSTDAVAKAVASDGYRFNSLVTSVVLSEPFRKRKGEATKTK